MTDYKQTLNLLQTNFPMQAKLAQQEPKILARWQTIDLYKQRGHHAAGRPSFVLHDGPPYANGDIHIGHAVNKALKDIIIRAKFLSGFATPYVPGWDCHGLPIEINVEKKLGKVGSKVSAKVFRQACRVYAAEQLARQCADFKRLGVLGDWEHPYLTMDPRFEANVIRALATIYTKGYLQQGVKPVYWCFDCHSSLAEAEVVYQDKQSPSIDVKFTVVDLPVWLNKFQFDEPTQQGQGDVSLVIWTTTPWTLPANRGVALHPELSYVLVQLGAERLIIARDLVTAVMARYGREDYQVLASAPGAALVMLQLQHPFYAYTVPVVLGEHVTLDAGTGAVHIAPSHGEDDYKLGKQYQLPMDLWVQGNGYFVADLALFGGARIWQAQADVIAALQARHKLVHHTMINHSYPHCWRHKTPLIYRATPQWFINMEHKNLRQQALAVTTAVHWMPTWGQERMVKMLQGRPDWCISRQRSWGVPIPLFVHKHTQQPHPDSSHIMAQVAQLVEQHTIEAWFDAPAAFFGVDASQYDKLNDVLDVWFDAGATHHAVLNQAVQQQWPELRFPADLYLEGSDQYRGWFQSSLLSSVAIHGRAPYQQILTHGFVVDAQGRKMSKSLGNVIAPEKILNSLGADILRLWVALTDYKTEMVISDEVLTRTTDVYRRIRNTIRFLLANTTDFDPQQDMVAITQMLEIDRWVLATAATYQEKILQDYENYTLPFIVQKIQHFCAVELGGFYLDVIKDRQYTCQAHSLARRSAQTAMFHLLEAMVRWIAPVLVFTADEIWQYMPARQAPSVHLALWYKPLAEYALAAQLGAHWEVIIAVRTAVNKQLEKQRQQGKIGAPLEAAVTLFAKGEIKSILVALSDELRFILITSSAIVQDWELKSSDAVSTDLADLAIQVVASPYEKCSRCWHRCRTVDQQADYPGLCSRCVENVAGTGETRRFA